MKLTLISDTLQKKLPFLNKVVSQRSQLPILLNYKITAMENILEISATDLEIGIQVRIQSPIEEEGGITVPAKIFSELIASLPSEKITFSTKPEGLEVKSSTTTSTFQTMPTDDFPKLFEEKGKELISLSNKLLKQTIGVVVFAASIDTTRPALSGVFLTQDEEGLLLVATDGYRLSLKKTVMKGVVVEKPLLIPARILREVMGLKTDEEGEMKVFVASESNQILFEEDETILVGRLIDAQFPAYQKIIPVDKATTVVFDREQMQKAVKICSIFSRDSANIVKFSVGSEGITIAANTPSVGQNFVKVEAKVTGEENEIAFNARYLLDLFANVDAAEMVFEMTGPLNPGVFKIKDDDSFLHIIMPIRVQG